MASRSEENGDLTDADKLKNAIKEATMKRARKAVNTSLEVSFGRLKRRRLAQVKNSKNQSFVLRQASALQLKNKAFAVELAKTRQINTQLERVNYYLKDKQMYFAMKYASSKKKLQSTMEMYEKLKSQMEVKDKLLSSLQNQLSSMLLNIKSVQEGCTTDDETTHVVSRKPQRIERHLYADHNEEEAEESDSDDEAELPKFGQKGPKPPRNVPQMSILEELDDFCRNDDANSESESDVDDSESDADQSESENEDFGVRVEENISENEETIQKGSLDVAMAVHKKKTRPSNYERFSIDPHEKTNADLRLNVSFSSLSSSSEKENEELDSSTLENSGFVEVEAISEENGEMVRKEVSCSSTNRCQIAMDLTPVNSEVIQIQDSRENLEKTREKDFPKSLQSEESILRGKNNTENSSVAEMLLEDGITPPQRKPKAKRGRAPLEQKQNKLKILKNKQDHVYEFLSASSDSFISDPKKSVKLNSSKSFSPVRQKKEETVHRFSEPGLEENEDPSTRRSSRRRAGPTSYVEPKLSTKLRRGDKIADGSLFVTISPKKRKQLKKGRNQRS